jgi:hypothetical protein
VLIPSGTGACASVSSVSSDGVAARVFRSPELIHVVLWYAVIELLQGDPGIILESSDQRLEVFLSELHSCGDFTNTPPRCSVK